MSLVAPRSAESRPTAGANAVLASVATAARFVAGWPADRCRAFLVGLLVVVAIEFGFSGLGTEARRVLQVFALAIVGWTLTRLDDTLVALLAATAAAIAIGDTEELFESLGDELIWLMLAAFVLAAALRETGIAGRLADLATRRATSVRQVFHGLTAAIAATAFLVPSTSGRAALMVPVFLGVAGATTEPRIRKALALLFPTVILLSAIASLTGAGAHVLAADLLAEIGEARIGFLDWALLGVPFAVVSCFLSAEAILRLFLTSTERRSGLVAPVDAAPLGERARPVLGIVGLVLLGWITEPLHGLDDTLVALLGALAVTLPGIGGIDFKTGLKGVEWSLVLFMAATIMLAEAIVESGLAETLAAASLGALDGSLPPLSVVGLVALVGLLAHLVIHSRTARVAILLPPILVAAPGAGVSPEAAAFVAVAATGFCQLLTVGAKPVALFGAVEGGTFVQRDLLRLGAVLLPLHLALLLAFAALVWPLLGLDLAAT